MQVSVVLSTRDRAQALWGTLGALERLERGGLEVEVIVVDNASADETQAVVRNWHPAGLEVMLLEERLPGKSRALNLALGKARGDVLLFLDDDVRPGPRWLLAMCEPIRAGAADAVGGRVEPAPELRRPWMTRFHLGRLACTDGSTTATAGLFGANMAVSRRVLERVGGFEPELGAGALGACEDSFFSLQLREAGFRIAAAGGDSLALHHFDPSRLRRPAFLENALFFGRSTAWISRHWFHDEPGWPAVRRARSRLGLWWVRLSEPGPRGAAEGISPREFHQVQRVAFYRQLGLERGRPRAYSRRGLVRVEAGGR